MGFNSVKIEKNSLNMDTIKDYLLITKRHKVGQINNYQNMPVQQLEMYLQVFLQYYNTILHIKNKYVSGTKVSRWSLIVSFNPFHPTVETKLKHSFINYSTRIYRAVVGGRMEGMFSRTFVSNRKLSKQVWLLGEFFLISFSIVV